MASTYALPLNPAAQTRHGHSRSQFLSGPSPWNGQPNGTAPVNGNAPSGGHRHYNSEMDGQLRGGQIVSPYAESHEHSQSHSHDHDHSHDRSRSTEYSLPFKPFTTARPKLRPRGESDLGKPPSRTTTTTKKFGFSPIQEGPPPPPLPASSWLELPEALTALLIPLPFLFASLAYPNIVAQARGLPSKFVSGSDQLLETVSTQPETFSANALPHNSRLLHACTLSSTTLILVGIISKIRSSVDQPLDRRKSFGNTENPGSTLDALWRIDSVWRILINTISVVLPFYATMQLGGTKTALLLLAAVTAGVGGLEQKPGKHTLWDSLKRTLRTRKATCATACLLMILDVLGSVDRSGELLGYLALTTSVLAMPPPLPTAGWSLVTGLKGQNNLWSTQGSARLSLPKPSSPLINTPEDTLLTLGSGALLMVITVVHSIFSSASPSIAHHAILFSTLSVASATALIYFALPSALRSQRKAGLAVGCILIAAFALWEQPISWQASVLFPLISALVFGAITFDTRTPVVPHSQSHSQSGHKHSHAHHDHDHDHDHHLHGNHSRLSAFLIGRCTPGSILHSILMEKDSRRIAYFGVLNLSFMLIQFFYGFVSGSLGLLTDSIHMLFDCAGLAVGLAAAVMSKWRPNVHFPYGYGKVDTLSGFANGVFLLLVSVEIIFDAFERLWEGSELHRLNELLIVSVLGFLVNIVGLTAFGHAHHGHGHSHDHGDGDHDHGHGHSHDNENMQGIFLHILADALGSVAVIISTLLTKYYGWAGWDPIASGIIAILIFASAIPLVKSSGMRLLLSLPADVEYRIRNTLQEVSSLRGVVGYSVPRFWLEDEGAAHAEVHAKEKEGCEHDHSHAGHDHSNHDHDHSGHDHGHSHSHDDSSPPSHSEAHDHDHDHSGHDHSSHDHGHGHDHDHDHNHNHDHSHDHNHAPHQQRVLGVIHIIASRIANPEDVRERTVQFLKGRGMDIVVHIEKEGEGRCWCGGGNKTS